jgi:hypothetical protein
VLTFSELSIHLSSQDMEQIRRSGHVRNLHVAVLVLAVELFWCREDSWIFVAKLEVSFHPSRRMLWTLAIVSMRQGENEARSLKPFDFSRGNKLINDALSVVGKVAKLSFPHDKCIW